MGAFAATAAAPGLFGAPARRPRQPARNSPHAVRPILKSDGQPTLIWDVPGNPLSGEPGPGDFAEGKLAYNSNATGGFLTVKDIQTGATIFKNDILTIGGTPRIQNGLVYTMVGVDLVATNPLLEPGHATVWSRFTGMISDINLVNGKLLFAEVGGNTCHITMLDTATQQVVWSCDTGLTFPAFSTFVPQVIPSGDLLIARVNDHVVAIDSDCGVVRWSQVVGSLADLAGNPISAGANYVYAISDNNPAGTLHALRLDTGKQVWQWSNNNTFASPVLNGQFLYLPDSGGNLNVLVAGEGVNGQGVPAYAALPLGGDLTHSRCFLEDGVAYLTGNNSVYAVDLTTEAPKVISYKADSVAKLIGVENGVCCFSHNSGKNIAAVDMADQLHQLWCESQLMADDYVSPSGSATDTRPTSTWYRTQVQLMDTVGAPRVNKSVKVSL